MLSEQAHEGGSRHLGDLGALADAEAMLTDLIDRPQSPELDAEHRRIGIAEHVARQLDVNGDGGERLAHTWHVTPARVCGPSAPSDAVSDGRLVLDVGSGDVADNVIEELHLIGIFDVSEPT